MFNDHVNNDIFYGINRYGSDKEETFGWCSPDSWGEYCYDHSYSQNDLLPITDKITEDMLLSDVRHFIVYIDKNWR